MISFRAEARLAGAELAEGAGVAGVGALAGRGMERVEAGGEALQLLPDPLVDRPERAAGISWRIDQQAALMVGAEIEAVPAVIRQQVHRPHQESGRAGRSRRRRRTRNRACTRAAAVLLQQRAVELGPALLLGEHARR